MIERELKILLTKEQYEFIRSHFMRKCEETHQINHYFDTDDFQMNEIGITCRIREVNGHCTATIKSHSSFIPGESLEKSKEACDRWDKSLFENLKVSFKGSLATKRLSKTISEGLTLFLDESLYLGIRDYELEIEYSKGKYDKARRELLSIAHSLNEYGMVESEYEFINRLNETHNKSYRFFATLKGR